MDDVAWAIAAVLGLVGDVDGSGLAEFARLTERVVLVDERNVRVLCCGANVVEIEVGHDLMELEEVV